MQKLGDATVSLGRKAAPIISSKAKEMLPTKITTTLSETNDSGRSRMDNVMEVATAGVRGQ